jgi:peroxiredoxin
MRRPLFLAAGAAIAASLLAARALRTQPLEIGRPAPSFRLAGLNGRTVSLSDYKGKAVVLNFWATWCSDCREEFPALDDLQRRYKAAGLEVVAPSVDETGRTAVLPFVARTSPSFTILLADPSTARAYGVRGLPSTFLIAPDGSVAGRYIGPIQPRELENDILKLLPRRRS